MLESSALAVVNFSLAADLNFSTGITDRAGQLDSQKHPHETNIDVSLVKNLASFVLKLLTIKLEVPEEDGAEEALGLGTLSGSTEDVPCVLATVY